VRTIRRGSGGDDSGRGWRAEPTASRSLDIGYGTAVDLDAENGAGEHVLGIAEGLARGGHRVLLVAAGSRETTTTSSRLERQLVGRGTVGSVRSARRVGRSILDAVRVARPDVVYLRSFPMDYVLLTRRLVALGAPVVLEINTIMSGEYAARGKPLRGRLYDGFQSRSLAAVSGWVVMSPRLQEFAQQVSRTRKPSLLGRNGYDPGRLRPEVPRDVVRRRLGVEGSDHVLLMAGFSRPWHGADRAISLLAELPPAVRLWLVGGRDEGVERQLRELASRLGVEERITIFPWQAHGDLASLTAAADVGLGPLALDRKRLIENQPLKIAVYLALGLPVLVNHVDPRFSGKEVFLRCVCTSEPAVLARELAPLLDTSDDVRERAREFARRELTWDVAAAETAAFLEQLVASRLAR
jgi:glycosyltransferase involved in cell wall biosynthesis